MNNCDTLQKNNTPYYCFYGCPMHLPRFFAYLTVLSMSVGHQSQGKHIVRQLQRDILYDRYFIASILQSPL